MTTRDNGNAAAILLIGVVIGLGSGIAAGLALGREEAAAGVQREAAERGFGSYVADPASGTPTWQWRDATTR